MKDTYVAIDLETTGLSPEKNQILEIGAWKVENAQVVSHYETLVQCPHPIDMRIQQLTGITDEMAAAGIPEQQAVKEMLEFCGNATILGHNIRFDYSFMKAAALRYGYTYEADAIDTLKIAKKVLPDVPKRNLEYLCEYFGIETSESHRALEDARAAMELYKRLNGVTAQQTDLFDGEQMFYKTPKKEPITPAQKKYLGDLLAYHRLPREADINSLTKSEASRKIDEIIREHGRIQRFRSKF